MIHHRYRNVAIVPALALAASVACAQGDSTDAPSPSLEATTTDGLLRTDEAGNLIVDRQAQWLYDYFLTADGEVPDDAIRAEVVAEANRRMDDDAASDAIALFDAYVAYRREAAEAGQEEEVTLEEAAERMRQAYDQNLGTMDAFAWERERIEFAVTAAKMLAEDDVDGDQLAMARRELVSELAAETSQEVRDQATGPARANRAVREARARGADDDEVFAIRAEILGEDAAARLAALDAEREAFRDRVRDYRAEKRRLRDRLGEHEAEVAIEALRAERFEKDDLRRVRALDRIEPARR